MRADLLQAQAIRRQVLQVRLWAVVRLQHRPVAAAAAAAAAWTVAEVSSKPVHRNAGSEAHHHGRAPPWARLIGCLVRYTRQQR